MARTAEASSAQLPSGPYRGTPLNSAFLAHEIFLRPARPVRSPPDRRKTRGNGAATIRGGFRRIGPSFPAFNVVLGGEQTSVLVLSSHPEIVLNSVFSGRVPAAPS